MTDSERLYVRFDQDCPCSNFEDMIKSKDFRKGVAIVLKQLEKYDKKYIMGLLEKLATKHWTAFSNKEIKDLKKFFMDPEVLSMAKKFFFLKNIKLKNVVGHTEGLIKFSNLLNELFVNPNRIIIQGIESALCLDEKGRLFRSIVNLMPEDGK